VIRSSTRIRTLLGAWLVFAGWLGLAHLTWAEDGELPPVSAPSFPSLHRELDRASDFAPAGVLLDHTHERGDWTFLYRYQRDDADQLMQGENTLSVAQYQAQYMGVYTSRPVSQLSQLHTFGVMYAPHPRFTLAMMLPFVQKSLDQFQDVGGFDRQETSGIGDVKAMVLLPFMQKGGQKTQFNIVLSLPTGSIRVDGRDGSRLPYSMQHGTGSWDILWGLTYTGKEQGLSWGAQVESQYRMSTNDLGYEFGAVYEASGWLAVEASSWLSLSVRLGWTKTENIKGSDPDLVLAASPLNNPNLQAGTLVEVGPGFNVLVPIFGGQRLCFEALFSIYESVEGPQLTSDAQFTAGWQWLF
jgi:hypothetical protein